MRTAIWDTFPEPNRRLLQRYLINYFSFYDIFLFQRSHWFLSSFKTIYCYLCYLMCQTSGL